MSNVLRRLISVLGISLLFVLIPTFANAEELSLNAFKAVPNSDGSTDYSVTLQILIVMTALSFLPAIIIMMTSFTRIIIVLSFTRNALGLQQSPPNQVLIGLALFLTMFVMNPVITDIKTKTLSTIKYQVDKLKDGEIIFKNKRKIRRKVKVSKVSSAYDFNGCECLLNALLL